MTDWSDPATWHPLLDWHSTRPPYPWSGLTDPYPVWVSETMLQQTTAATVRARFEAWFRDFPTVEDLARADEERVLKAWEGLGYYNRARCLHRAARTVVAKGWPHTPEEWQRLPGVGPYAARAVSSFCEGWPVAAYDTNVKRILCRLEAVPEWSRALESTWEERLGRLFANGLPSGRLNAALMRLGQDVCTRNVPTCDTCPLAALCRSRAEGVQAGIPRRPSRPAPVRETLYPRLLVDPRTPALSLVRSTAARFRNQYLPPMGIQGWWLEHPRRVFLGSWRHTVTHHRYTLLCWAVAVDREPMEGTDGTWIPVANLESVPMPTVYRSVTRALAEVLTLGRI